ncbi:hypothetical protein AUJ84_04260 [Candidatus Pacearchaeota archaeon CG1_02_32_132]|nr:MAG: hypothetical protein AUJ84_04260 [Candidatus Pacearchaeota archaeon CG1_02_32_132]
MGKTNSKKEILIYRVIIILIIIASIFVIFGNFILYKNSSNFSKGFINAKTTSETATASITIEAAPTPAPSPPSGGGSTGGGGSGGGGGGASSSEKLVDFSITPEELNLFLQEGEQQEQLITVKNSFNSDIVISISVTGIGNYVGLDSNQLSLKKGEEKTVLLSVRAPGQGIYAGSIKFTTGNIERKAFVLMNVRSAGKALFDVSLFIPDSSRLISIGKKVKAFISLIQLGELGEVDTVINYVIKDFDGNTLSSETETFRVFKEKSYVREFSTEKLSSGDYIVGIEVIYPEGFATSSAHFTVAEKIINKGIIYMIVLVLLTILVVIFSIYKYKKATRQLNKRLKKR